MDISPGHITVSFPLASQMAACTASQIRSMPHAWAPVPLGYGLGVSLPLASSGGRIHRNSVHAVCLGTCATRLWIGSLFALGVLGGIVHCDPNSGHVVKPGHNTTRIGNLFQILSGPSLGHMDWESLSPWRLSWQRTLQAEFGPWRMAPGRLCC